MFEHVASQHNDFTMGIMIFVSDELGKLVSVSEYYDGSIFCRSQTQDITRKLFSFHFFPHHTSPCTIHHPNLHYLINLTGPAGM